MQQQEAEKIVIEIASVVLGQPVDANTSRQTHSSWDSLKHMQIIFGIEERCEIQLSEDEIAAATTVTKLAEAVVKYHAT